MDSCTAQPDFEYASHVFNMATASLPIKVDSLSPRFILFTVKGFVRVAVWRLQPRRKCPTKTLD